MVPSSYAERERDRGSTTIFPFFDWSTMMAGWSGRPKWRPRCRSGPRTCRFFPLTGRVPVDARADAIGEGEWSWLFARQLLESETQVFAGGTGSCVAPAR